VTGKGGGRGGGAEVEILIEGGGGAVIEGRRRGGKTWKADEEGNVWKNGEIWPETAYTQGKSGKTVGMAPWEIHKKKKTGGGMCRREGGGKKKL